MLFNVGGLLHRVELYGPACLDEWIESWNVLGALLIAAKAVSRESLKEYKTWIISQAKLYGATVWPLLYQTDVRCRSERMPLIRDQLVAAHNAAMIAQRPSTFDCDRPWDQAFFNSVTSADSLRWWSKEFEKPAMLILTRTANLNSMIEGDARVEQSNSSSLHTAPRDAPLVDDVYRGRQGAAKRQPPRTQPQQPPQQSSGSLKKPQGSYTGPAYENGEHKCNRARFPLCAYFNTPNGCNRGTDRNNVCRGDGVSVHQCSKCLKQDHGASSCRETEGQQQPPSKKKRTDKGKGKGKRQ